MENKWNSGVRAGGLGLSVRSWSAKLLLTTILFLFPLCFLLSACLPVSTSSSYPVSTSSSYPVSTLSYYVSTTGNDANPGTINQPWKTIQKAADVAVAGDTVNVAAGSYGERVYATTNSGKSGSPITFQAQGKVVIKGFIVRANYVIVNGFEIANNDKNNVGVQIKGAYNIIENNYLHHLSGTGIEFYAYIFDNTTLVTHDNIVRNNKLYYIQSSGISVSGRNNIVENNEVWGIQQCLPINGGCGGSDADGIYFFGQGHIIRGNYIHDISYGPPGINPSVGDYVNDAHIDCFQTWASSMFETASNILFEGNFCDNLQYQKDTEKGQGWMVPNGANNITFRNNVVRAYRGINNNGVDNFADHLYIYNNTFINDLSFPAQPNVAELYNATHSIIKNNIFYNQKNSTINLAEDTTGIVIDYNLVYNTDGSLPTYFDYPQLHELRKLDPLFVNAAAKDYHLQAGSPAIDSGTNVDLVNDYDGNPRPQGTGFDIGAFEYSGGTTLTPTKSITFIPTGITTLQADLNKTFLYNSCIVFTNDRLCAIYHRFKFVQ